MQSGIYGIHNVINGKWYVGQSINIPRRKIHHLSYLRSGKHKNKHLQLSFNKYGESAFEFRILEEVAENMMDVRELAWIDYYESLNPRRGYNLDSGGNSNKHHSISTKMKMKEYFTLENRIKRSLSSTKKGKTSKHCLFMKKQQKLNKT